ncbi:flagellar hook-associated protein FlgK [Caldimonas brevitalea]|uniref:Flagellar hook-associated protein 1 n=1 Tax=Caldimonas brevitalea TaxID=413882 RepID=A0A0G3BLM7_9BURK|nr:flagellar hook-associated protein FlgK [Caldimonas brevitalea]AKJ30344.1 flagellar hook protein FlgK [Caldimonas brevitalea]
MSTIYNALSGALAAQAALNTASQNIANVMTPGYTRQGVMLVASKPSQAGALGAGDGVQVPALMRFSDGYKNLQLWQAASELGERETVQPYLTQLEQVMGDEASSINSGLDAFFGALNAASVEPTSSPLRRQVITSADALAQRFNSLDQVLAHQRASIYQQRLSSVAQINTLTADIASLNKEISATRATGLNPSGLIDERDQKIDALAGLVGVQVVDQTDGSRSVSLRGGQPLVVGIGAATMAAVGLPDGSQKLTLNFARESFTLSPDGLGGPLGGLNDFERRVLAPLSDSITAMAGELADKFNTQLAAGYAMDGSAGTALFQFDASSVGGLLQVHTEMEAGELALSADPTQPGNSDNLLALIAIKQQPVSAGVLGNVLLGDAYTQLVGKLGMDSQQNQTALKTAETVRNQAEESWKSTSGVNSDEEAINLMQYQQMYQSNMKVIAVANQLFDATLAMFR